MLVNILIVAALIFLALGLYELEHRIGGDK